MRAGESEQGFVGEMEYKARRRGVIGGLGAMDGERDVLQAPAQTYVTGPIAVFIIVQTRFIAVVGPTGRVECVL